MAWHPAPSRSAGFATLNVTDEQLVQVIAAEAIRKADRLTRRGKGGIQLTMGVTMVILWYLKF